MIRKALAKDIPEIQRLDDKAFPDDKRTIKLSNKVKKFYVYCEKKIVKAFIEYMIMPNKDKDFYIVSIAGNQKNKCKLVQFFIDVYSNKRFYTHGKSLWKTEFLLKLGFKNIGKGNIKDECVDFYFDISKLDTYEKKASTI
jgi:hypothetical protein